MRVRVRVVRRWREERVLTQHESRAANCRVKEPAVVNNVLGAVHENLQSQVRRQVLLQEVGWGLGLMQWVVCVQGCGTCSQTCINCLSSTGLATEWTLYMYS